MIYFEDIFYVKIAFRP